MWKRNLGIVVILGAGLLFYRTAPKAQRAQPVLADVPMHSTDRARVPFHVTETGYYQVAVSYRYSAPTHQDENKPFVEPQFFCEFWDTGPAPRDGQEGTALAKQYTPTSFIRESAMLRPSLMTVRTDSDGRTYLLDSYCLEAGHKYHASILTLRGQDLLKGRSPRVHVLRKNGYPGYPSYVRAIAAINCGGLIGAGLWLTCWGGSRVPIRSVFRHKR